MTKTDRRFTWNIGEWKHWWRLQQNRWFGWMRKWKALHLLHALLVHFCDVLWKGTRWNCVISAREFSRQRELQMVNPSSSAPKVFGLAVQFRLLGKFDVLVRTVWTKESTSYWFHCSVGCSSEIKNLVVWWSLASYLSLFITKKKKVRSFGINPE